MSREADPGDWIGHYGCGRLVKVAANEADERANHGWYKPRAVHRITCPGCGYEHKVRVTWRRPIRVDEAKEAEVNL